MEEPLYPIGCKRGRPTREVPLGGEFERYGVTLVCVRRPPDVWPPCNACKGCWFKKGRKDIDGHKVISNCEDIRCSRHDRMDGIDVWYVAKDE